MIDPESRIVIHDDNATYETWCKTLGLDPEDDNNWISYSEMMNNAK